MNKRSSFCFFIISSFFVFAVFIPNLNSLSIEPQHLANSLKVDEPSSKLIEKEVTHGTKPSASNNNPKKFYRYSSRKRFNLRSETAMLNNSSKLIVTKENRIRSNKKRCRYSDSEIEYLNLLNKNKQSQLASPNSFNSLYHINTNKQHHIAVKQPRTRDQFNNRHNSNSNPDEYSIEIQPEFMYVNEGDMINLTCLVNTREIDWHFKDKNLTTTIISYGLELQVIQPIYIDGSFVNAFNGDSEIHYNKFNSMSRRSGTGQHRILKYKVTSDKQFSHMLTVFIQGEQDEGTYQCIDSKSETPLIKTIRVILSNLFFCFFTLMSNSNILNINLFLILENNSRALNVGLVKNKPTIIYTMIFLFLSKLFLKL